MAPPAIRRDALFVGVFIATHGQLMSTWGFQDFESRILAKLAAPVLLRQELSPNTWKPRPLALRGTTDPYQSGALVAADSTLLGGTGRVS